jgi:hypothetical protein
MKRRPDAAPFYISFLIAASSSASLIRPGW